MFGCEQNTTASKIYGFPRTDRFQGPGVNHGVLDVFPEGKPARTSPINVASEDCTSFISAFFHVTSIMPVIAIRQQ
jgi:hypothetical protein